MRLGAIAGAASLAGAVWLAGGGAARADTPPSIWTDALRPGASREYAIHVDASQILLRANYAQHPPFGLSYEQGQQWKAQRRRMLEMLRDSLAGTEGARDPYLRYDRAWLAIESVSPQEDYPLPIARATLLDAVALLEPLAKELGAVPLSSDVWHKLAECYVRLEQPEEEIRAYDEELSRAIEDGERAVPLLNQGEAYMRTGQAGLAVQQFREVLRLSGLMPYGNDIGILAQWDIAVALDRSGDARGGLEAARVALHMDNTLNMRGLFRVSVFNPEVYFVPDYEREWYLGLGEAALALDEDSPADAVADLTRAEGFFRAYVNEAKPGDRFVDLAQKRLGEIEVRRLEAQKRAVARVAKTR